MTDMTTTSRRIVFSGFGVISPIGSSPAAFWSALLAGTPGIHTITRVDPSALPSKMAGEVRDFSAKALIEKSYRRTLNAMARTVEFGAIGCQFAMQDAGLSKGSVPPRGSESTLPQSWEPQSWTISGQQASAP